MAGRGDSNVGRGAAKVLAEGRNILRANPNVIRVNINADAPDREQFVGTVTVDLSFGIRQDSKNGSPPPAGERSV
jgi:hypothetical protein